MARIPKICVPKDWIHGAKSTRNTQRRYVDLEAVNLGDGRYRVTLPVYLPSVANLREHYRTKAKRTSQHRHDAHCALWALAVPKGQSWRITIKRIGPKALDQDNAVSACKGLVDGIADALGFRDDSDRRLEWVYRQERRGSLYGVEIMLERTGT